MNTSTRIRELRLEKLQLKQRELADKLGVQPITVSRWERGVTTPSDLHRVLLARLFGMHPNDFLDHGDDEVAA